MLRFGIGFDSHRLVEGRRFILGGIEIPSDFGPAGHSDGDALLHSIADALLSAAGIDEDIGTLFPDTDESLKNADSRVLLRKIAELVKSKGVKIVQVDSVIVLEKPKISHHRDRIKSSIAEILGVSKRDVSVKGKTPEGLGAGGTVACFSIAVVECRR